VVLSDIGPVRGVAGRELIRLVWSVPNYGAFATGVGVSGWSQPLTTVAGWRWYGYRLGTVSASVSGGSFWVRPGTDVGKAKVIG
jgi:hypothetical protein